MSKVTVWFYDFPHICKLNDFQGSQTASLLSELATEFPVLFGIERLIKKYIRTGALGYTWTDKSSHSIKDLNINNSENVPKISWPSLDSKLCSKMSCGWHWRRTLAHLLFVQFWVSPNTIHFNIINLTISNWKPYSTLFLYCSLFITSIKIHMNYSKSILESWQLSCTSVMFVMQIIFLEWLGLIVFQDDHHSPVSCFYCLLQEWWRDRCMVLAMVIRKWKGQFFVRPITNHRFKGRR